MDLEEPAPRPPRESIVPMINVVFLLLIFFLMTATIAPPEPFELTLPESAIDAPSEAGLPVFVAADGRISWNGQSGDAALRAAAAAWVRGDRQEPLMVRADRNVPAVRVAGLILRLTDAGVTQSQLVSEAIE